MDACVVCHEIAGTIALPGGALVTSEYTVAFHIPALRGPDVYYGHLLVVPKRHVADFAGLEEREAAEIGVSIGQCSHALKGVGSDRVYVATVGHGIDHLHVHLLPRWPETPADVAWHAVDEWPGARRVTAEQAADVVARLRVKLS